MTRDADSQQRAEDGKRRLTPEERVALAQRIRSKTPAGIIQTDSAALIREDRDAKDNYR